MNTSLKKYSHTLLVSLIKKYGFKEFITNFKSYHINGLRIIHPEIYSPRKTHPYLGKIFIPMLFPRKNYLQDNLPPSELTPKLTPMFIALVGERPADSVMCEFSLIHIIIVFIWNIMYKTILMFLIPSLPFFIQLLPKEKRS